MARTTTLGSIETRVRRDLVNDFEPDGYRWSVIQVMSQIRAMILDVAFNHNAWAAYDQDTGKRYYDIETSLAPVKAAADAAPDVARSNEDGGTFDESLRAIVMPIDDRYAEAVANLVAARLLETDNSDTANANRSAYFQTKGKELAAR